MNSSYNCVTIVIHLAGGRIKIIKNELKHLCVESIGYLHN